MRLWRDTGEAIMRSFGDQWIRDMRHQGYRARWTLLGPQTYVPVAFGPDVTPPGSAR